MGYKYYVTDELTHETNVVNEDGVFEVAMTHGLDKHWYNNLVHKGKTANFISKATHHVMTIKRG